MAKTNSYSGITLALKKLDEYLPEVECSCGELVSIKEFIHGEANACERKCLKCRVGGGDWLSVYNKTTFRVNGIKSKKKPRMTFRLLSNLSALEESGCYHCMDDVPSWAYLDKWGRVPASIFANPTVFKSAAKICPQCRKTMSDNVTENYKIQNFIEVESKEDIQIRKYQQRLSAQVQRMAENEELKRMRKLTSVKRNPDGHSAEYSDGEVFLTRLRCDTCKIVFDREEFYVRDKQGNKKCESRHCVECRKVIKRKYNDKRDSQYKDAGFISIQKAIYESEASTIPCAFCRRLTSEKQFFYRVSDLTLSPLMNKPWKSPTKYVIAHSSCARVQRKKQMIIQISQIEKTVR